MAMDGQKLVLSIAVVVLGIACFIVGTVALIIPQWGTFRTRVHAERGNFGPWTMCKDIGYGNQVCGTKVSSFRPSFAVFAAGICGAVGTGALGFYCLISLFQIAMQVTKSEALAKYYFAVIAKLLCAVIAALLTIVAVCLFSVQGDDLERGYIIESGVSFYLEVVLAIFTFILMVLTVVEFTIARRNRPHDKTGRVIKTARHQGLLQSGFGTSIGTPGYRENRANTNGISMTDSSVRFVSPSSMSKLPPSLQYPNSSLSKQSGRLALARNLSTNSQRRKQSKSKSSKKSKKSSSFKGSPRGKKKKTSIATDPNWNGSISSIGAASNGSSISVLDSTSTLSTIASFQAVSPLPRGPLRSSLKKSKPPTDEFGVPNPGFSGTSPTLSRTGSLKKVRIQTHTTDV